jgi:hypothetical protein
VNVSRIAWIALKKKRIANEVDFSNDKKLAARFPLKGPLKRCGS